MNPIDESDPAASLPGIPTAIILASLVAPVFLVPLLSVGVTMPIAGTVAGGAFIVLLWIARRGSTRALPVSRTATVLWMILAVIAGARLAHLSVFMLDADRLDHAITPPMRPMDAPGMDRPFVKHNCFTCYVIAAHLAEHEPGEVYNRERYRPAVKPTPIHDAIGDAVTIDTFQYPPPFLMVPHAMALGGFDFFQLRTLWFALNVCLIALTFLAVVVFVDHGRFGPLWLAWPAMILAPTTLLSLQMGNVHLMVICLSVLAMIAIERQHHAIGGVVLGYVVCAKLFPGVLVAVLLFEKKWRAVLWTVAAMAGWLTLTYLTFGPQVFEAFGSEQMPRLASGEAFSFAFTFLRAVIVNSSVMGLPYKLRELGLIDEAAAPALARLMIIGFTVLLLGLLILAAARLRSTSAQDAWGRLARLQIIVAVIILGQLRSPFLPWPYGHFAVLLLIPLVAAGQRIQWVALLVPLWLCLASHVPLGIGPPSARLDVLFTLIVQLVVLVMCVALVARRRGARLSPEP